MLKNKKNCNSRREFLKKTAYSAPLLFTLGQLTQPANLHADFSGGPEGPPDDFFDFYESESTNRRVDSSEYNKERKRADRPQK